MQTNILFKNLFLEIHEKTFDIIFSNVIFWV
jgi:hypothetical protein